MKMYLVLLAVLAAGTAQASNCKYEKDLDVALNLAGSEQLSIRARAGHLRVTGYPGTSEARARGKVCASEKEWLDAAEIVTEGGSNARIEVSLPDVGDGWSLMGDRYVYMDLEIDVPDTVALEIADSSGDLEVLRTGAVAIKDSSGDIDVQEVRGDVALEDSSGDIELLAIAGNVTVRRDSSGDIEGRDIRGSVRIEQDSSGLIRFRDVRDDFVVERDSSGDIVADSVGGDFRVLRDGSGDIESTNVTGAVEIPDRG